jgi:hypothetical protein
MLVRLVRPMKREGSSKKYFVQRIPSDVKAAAVGMTLTIPVGDTLVPIKITSKTTAVRLSLRTSDHSEAKVRQASVAAYLECIWRSLRGRPRSLTSKEAVALGGEVYKVFAGAVEDDPGESETWRRVREDNAAALAGQYGTAALLIGEDARSAAGVEERFGGFADVVLARRRLRVDTGSRTKLLQQVARAMDEAAEKLQRNAEGDYRVDESVGRFPEWQEKPKVEAPISVNGATITGLRDAWAKEATAAGKASEGTVRTYDHSIRKLIEFLGHDDASQVTPENIVAFKHARLAEIIPSGVGPVDCGGAQRDE